MPGGIFSTGVDGTRVVLQRHGATGGKEILGVTQATDGNNTEEILHLRIKAGAFAESLQTGMLPKSDAWFALTATTLKTMQHPMATTTMTERLEPFHGPFLRWGLPRAGLDRNFP